MSSSFSDIVEQYISLAHRFDKHQEGVVDAHYGKATEIKKKIHKEAIVPIEQLETDSDFILKHLEGEKCTRSKYLQAQTRALKTMIQKKRGIKFSFREEAKLCLGIDQIDWQDESEMKSAVDEIDEALGGKGKLNERFVEWRNKFELQGDEITEFILVAMKEAKSKTSSLFKIPENDVEVSLVRDKPWAGYHWYRGNYKSLYELNIDVPTTIWGVLHTTTHEAFCGHHTEAIVKESELVRKHGYDEFSINLLGTPCSTLSEGIAEAAQHLVIGEIDDVIQWLKSNEHLHKRTISDSDVHILKALETLGRKSIINLALLIHEQGATDAEALDYARKFSASEESLLKRTISRLRDGDYRTYMLTYPIGKDRIMNELNASKNQTKTFYDILKAVNYQFKSPSIN